MRVVVLGGTGNFGARVVRALRDEAGIELIAASRRATSVPGAPEVQAAVVDIDHGDLDLQLKSLAPDLVIHCAGPFQAQDYRVAHATLAAGANYLDLADGRDFVTGFSGAMHSHAVRMGRTAITGASTLPALSTAVIDVLSADFAQMDSIHMAIAPGQRAPRGAATLAGVLSYLGRPVRIWRNGRWQTGWGWMDLKRLDFGFGERLGALCEVPDLALLPMRYPGLRSASFRAALEIPVQQMILWMMAALRRMGLPLAVQHWAGALDWLASAFDHLGGDWGGMQVVVDGRSASGAGMQRTWTLRAPVMHGPETPCMAAILLAQKLARGERFAAGAFPCMGFLSLADFEPQFVRWGFTTHIA